jgi:hypothetical protein
MLSVLSEPLLEPEEPDEERPDVEDAVRVVLEPEELVEALLLEVLLVEAGFCKDT